MWPALRLRGSGRVADHVDAVCPGHLRLELSWLTLAQRPPWSAALAAVTTVPRVVRPEWH